LDLLGIQRCADPIQKDETRRREKNSNKGQQLLLPRRDSGAPILLLIEAAYLAQDPFETQFTQEVENSLIWDFIFVVYEDLAQAATGQVRPLG